MSIDISVPGGNPNKPGFSVQRSSSGLHINAGALASTNTMFGIANDEGGLSVSAWPAVPPPPIGPPLPTAYIASAYLLGIDTPTQFRIFVVYYTADGGEMDVTYTEVTSSLTEWQRFSHTRLVDPDAAYVSVRIYTPSQQAPTKAYFTAMQLEYGTTPTPYEVGGRNLLLNPELAIGVDHWWADAGWWYPLLGYSRASSLPSSPLPGVTTGLVFPPVGYSPGTWYSPTHDRIAVPAP